MPDLVDGYVDVTYEETGYVDVHSAPNIYSSGAATYSHHQVASAATWTVTHALPVPRVPLVLLDGDGGAPIIPDVDYSTPGVAVLTFPDPVTGWAYF